MIKFDNQLQNYIDFLNEKYPTQETVQLKPLYGSTTVSVNGIEGFGVYLNSPKTILLPMDVPAEVLEEESDWLFHNIAHEYKHFMDDIDGKRYCKKREKEADDFADKALEEYKEWIKCPQMTKKELTTKEQIKKYKRSFLTHITSIIYNIIALFLSGYLLQEGIIYKSTIDFIAGIIFPIGAAPLLAVSILCIIAEAKNYKKAKKELMEETNNDKHNEPN